MDLSKIIHNHLSYFYIKIENGYGKLLFSNIGKSDSLITELKIFNSFHVFYSFFCENEKLTEKLLLINNENIFLESIIPYNLFNLNFGIKFNSTVNQVIKLQIKLVTIPKNYLLFLQQNNYSFFDPKYNLCFQNNTIYSTIQSMDIDYTHNTFNNLTIYLGNEILINPKINNNYDITFYIYNYNCFELDFTQDLQNHICICYTLTKNIDIINKILIKSDYIFTKIKFEINNLEINIKSSIVGKYLFIEFNNLLVCLNKCTMKLYLYIEKKYYSFNNISCILYAGFFSQNCKKYFNEKQLIFLNEFNQKN